MNTSLGTQKQVVILKFSQLLFREDLDPKELGKLCSVPATYPYEERNKKTIRAWELQGKLPLDSTHFLGTIFPTDLPPSAVEQTCEIFFLPHDVLRIIIAYMFEDYHLSWDERQDASVFLEVCKAMRDMFLPLFRWYVPSSWWILRSSN